MLLGLPERCGSKREVSECLKRIRCPWASTKDLAAAGGRAPSAHLLTKGYASNEPSSKDLYRETALIYSIHSQILNGHIKEINWLAA